MENFKLFIGFRRAQSRYRNNMRHIDERGYNLTVHVQLALQ